MEPEQASHALPASPLPAVVVNPISVDDLVKLRTQITRECVELGWRAPLWLQTTVDDPGGGQAAAALAAGVCGQTSPLPWTADSSCLGKSVR